MELLFQSVSVRVDEHQAEHLDSRRHPRDIDHPRICPPSATAAYWRGGKAFLQECPRTDRVTVFKLI